MANKAPKPPTVVKTGVSSVNIAVQNTPNNINSLPPIFWAIIPPMICVTAYP